LPLTSAWRQRRHLLPLGSSKYAGLTLVDLNRLKASKEEDCCLKQLVADWALDNGAIGITLKILLSTQSETTSGNARHIKPWAGYQDSPAHRRSFLSF